jgi:hypothetical protein
MGRFMSFQRASLARCRMAIRVQPEFFLNIFPANCQKGDKSVKDAVELMVASFPGIARLGWKQTT